MAFVYHIHLPEDLGNFDEGYIGFTSKTVEHRYKEHKALAAKGEPYAIYNAIRKYGDLLQVTTIVEGRNDYCLLIENRLRPEPNMAWNIAVGGGAPMLGKKHSEATKAKFKARGTEEFRKHLSDLKKAIPIWQHGSSDPAVWAAADSVYDCYVARAFDIGPVLLARAFNLGNKKLEAMLRKLRGGWNPIDDPDWLKWQSTQTEKIECTWKPGDNLVEAKQAEHTDELRKAKAKGGKNRVWSAELREHMRQVNIGRKHTDETKKRLSDSRTGTKCSDAAKQAMSDARNKTPWNLGKQDGGHWANAADIMSMLCGGMIHAEILRHYNLDRKSSALSAIIRRLKAGWNPLQDENWLAFKAAYEKVANNGK